MVDRHLPRRRPARPRPGAHREGSRNLSYPVPSCCIKGGHTMDRAQERDITIETSAGTIHGTLAIPAGATGIVVFAHGSGSSRRSPRNREVAAALQDAAFAT